MNKYKNQNQLLDARILALENKRERNLRELQSQYNILMYELKPSNLISRAVDDIKEDLRVKNTFFESIFESVVSVLSGFLSKKILIGKSHSTFKKIIGYALQYFTTRIVSKKIKH